MDSLKQDIVDFIDKFVNEPNNKVTQIKIVAGIKDIIKHCKYKGITMIRILCDSRNNPKYLAVAGFLYCDVWVDTPMRSVHWQFEISPDIRAQSLQPIVIEIDGEKI